MRIFQTIFSAAPKLGLIAVMGAALWKIAIETPLLSPSERIVGPEGRWTTENWSDLLHPARYRLEQSRAFFNAGRRLEDPARKRAFFERADALAMDSLRLRPTNAFAWTAHGLARRALGDDAGARVALARSFEQAPQNVALALTRLRVLAGLWSDLTTPERRRLLSDLALAESARPATKDALDEIRASHPRLDLLVGPAQRRYPRDDTTP